MITTLLYFVFFPLFVCAQINSTMGMHSISSSDDVKPPFGLRPMSAHSPGIMLSQKRMCAICGDRSSGECCALRAGLVEVKRRAGDLF